MYSVYFTTDVWKSKLFLDSYSFVNFIKARNHSKLSVDLAKKLLLREFFHSKTIIRNQNVRPSLKEMKISFVLQSKVEIWFMGGQICCIKLKDSSLILEVCFTTGNLAPLRLDFDSASKYLDLIEILKNICQWPLMWSI